jgi:flavin-dependent dehydrogenase
MADTAHFDIAILGNGVAAAAAALALAQYRSAVVMIGEPVRAANRIGECLPPTANCLLRDLGIADRFAGIPHRPAHATYAAWETSTLAHRNSIVHVEGPGHVIDRCAFESMLTDAVAETDTMIIPAMVTDIRPLDGAWSLTLSDGDEVRGAFVLDCSGRSAIAARRLVGRRRIDRLVAAYDFLHQLDDGADPTPATLIEAVAEGWWYATLLPNRQIGLAFFSDPDIMPRRLSGDAAVWRRMVEGTRYLRQWLDSAGYAIGRAPKLESAGTLFLERAAGPGWAAAGDAAATFDPLSSHGLASALWSGKCAALAALDALDGDPTRLANYAATLADAIQGFLWQRQSIYAEVRCFRDQPFWSRRATMSV